MNNQFLLLLFLFFTFLSCKEDKQRTDAEKIVKEWIGKQVKFPDKFSCSYLGKDTTNRLCSDLLNKEYKLVLYVDSSGCTSCKLQLAAWKKIINEADTLFNDNLSFLFFFNPKNKDKKELSFLLRRDNFDYPIFIDLENEIQQLNNFPDHSQYQSFLLDKDNKVLMIGNPVSNPSIWELYKEQILGANMPNNKMRTSAKCDKEYHDYGDILINEEHETIFKITNTGQYPLVIFRVNTSCGCTSVDWKNELVNVGETTEIEVVMNPDETGHFNKTIDVYCNTEDSPIKLVVSGRTKN